MRQKGQTLILDYYDIETVVSNMQKGWSALDAAKILSHLVPYSIDDFEIFDTEIKVTIANKENIELALNAVKEFSVFVRKCNRSINEELTLRDMDWIFINRGWLLNTDPHEIIDELSITELESYINVAIKEKGYNNTDFIKPKIGFGFHVATVLQRKENELFNKNTLF